MTTISATIIADSISPRGNRLVTVHARYPRFIHAEVMTHRVFSRNARSSRAVPIATMIREIEDDPVIPLYWGKNQKGMQADEECAEPVRIFNRFLDRAPQWHAPREKAWLKARDHAVEIAKAFSESGYHKQVANRLLEAFMHIDTLISATDWANFLALRDHRDAEPHIADLARVVKRAMNESAPRILQPGEWHLPYIDVDTYQTAVDYLRNGVQIDPTEERINEVLKKVSAARCARISYAPFNGVGSIEAEIERHDLLVESAPVHASPTEHQATPDQWDGLGWTAPHRHRNFRGWVQYRSMIQNETVYDAA